MTRGELEAQRKEQWLTSTYDRLQQQYKHVSPFSYILGLFGISKTLNDLDQDCDQLRNRSNYFNTGAHVSYLDLDTGIHIGREKDPIDAYNEALTIMKTYPDTAGTLYLEQYKNTATNTHDIEL